MEQLPTIRIWDGFQCQFHQFHDFNAVLFHLRKSSYVYLKWLELKIALVVFSQSYVTPRWSVYSCTTGHADMINCFVSAITWSSSETLYEVVIYLVTFSIRFVVMFGGIHIEISAMKSVGTLLHDYGWTPNHTLVSSPFMVQPWLTVCYHGAQILLKTTLFAMFFPTINLCSTKYRRTDNVFDAYEPSSVKAETRSDRRRQSQGHKQWQHFLKLAEHPKRLRQ